MFRLIFVYFIAICIAVESLFVSERGQRRGQDADQSQVYSVDEDMAARNAWSTEYDKGDEFDDGSSRKKFDSLLRLVTAASLYPRLQHQQQQQHKHDQQLQVPEALANSKRWAPSEMRVDQLMQKLRSHVYKSRDKHSRATSSGGSDVNGNRNQNRQTPILVGRRSSRIYQQIGDDSTISADEWKDLIMPRNNPVWQGPRSAGQLYVENHGPERDDYRAIDDDVAGVKTHVADETRNSFSAVQDSEPLNRLARLLYMHAVERARHGTTD